MLFFRRGSNLGLLPSLSNLAVGRSSYDALHATTNQPPFVQPLYSFLGNHAHVHCCRVSAVGDNMLTPGTQQDHDIISVSLLRYRHVSGEMLNPVFSHIAMK